MSKRISQLTAAATLAGTELVEVSQLSASVTITGTTISADSTDNSFNDSGSGFVTAGFTTGKSVKVSGFTGNVANNITSGVVTSVAAGKIIIGGTDGDVIVTDAAGESVTITQWDSRRATAQDLADLAGVATGRETLTGNRTYYVRTDGSDSNDGLANTSGGAFLTVQKACDVITETLDLASYTVTVQVADGTYTGAVTLRDCTGRGGFSVAVLQGNSGTPANVLVSTTSANAILSTANATQWLVKDLKVQTTTSGHGLYASVNAYVSFSNIVFGACATSHINAAYGGTAAATGDYSITGAAPYHWLTSFGGRIIVGGRTVTITGTPAFSTGFAGAIHSSVVYCPSNTFSGSATGKRYKGIASNGIVDTGGGGSTYLPGGTAGDAPTTGGQYL